MRHAYKKIIYKEVHAWNHFIITKLRTTINLIAVGSNIETSFSVITTNICIIMAYRGKYLHNTYFILYLAIKSVVITLQNHERVPKMSSVYYPTYPYNLGFQLRGKEKKKIFLIRCQGEDNSLGAKSSARCVTNRRFMT